MELRATVSLARLWSDLGRRAQARDLLAPVYGWFNEGLDTPDLREAKALLDKLDRASGVPARLNEARTLPECIGRARACV